MIYGANTNWNSSCRQMERNTSVTERFLPDVGPGACWDDFWWWSLRLPQQDDRTQDVSVEQQHQAAHDPNCRAFHFGK